MNWIHCWLVNHSTDDYEGQGCTSSQATRKATSIYLGVGEHAFKVGFSPLCQFRWSYLVCLLCFHPRSVKIKPSITISYCVLWLEFSCPPSCRILLPKSLFICPSINGTEKSWTLKKNNRFAHGTLPFSHIVTMSN